MPSPPGNKKCYFNCSSDTATRAKETGGWGLRILFHRGPHSYGQMSQIHCAVWNSYCHLLWDPVLWTGSPIYIAVALRAKARRHRIWRQWPRRTRCLAQQAEHKAGREADKNISIGVQQRPSVGPFNFLPSYPVSILYSRAPKQTTHFLLFPFQII